MIVLIVIMILTKIIIVRSEFVDLSGCCCSGFIKEKKIVFRDGSYNGVQDEREANISGARPRMSSL